MFYTIKSSPLPVQSKFLCLQLFQAITNSDQSVALINSKHHNTRLNEMCSTDNSLKDPMKKPAVSQHQGMQIEHSLITNLGIKPIIIQI